MLDSAKKAFGLILAFLLLGGCAPPWSGYCRGLPDVRNQTLQEQEKSVAALSDDKVLDLIACQLSTSHPPALSFPDNLVIDRPSSMAFALLDRLQGPDEGFISATYADFLVVILSRNRDIFLPDKSVAAYKACIQHGGISCEKIKYENNQAGHPGRD